MKLSPLFNLLLALACSPPTLEGNIWLFSCQVLHYGLQLVAKKQLHATAGNHADESGETEPKH